MQNASAIVFYKCTTISTITITKAHNNQLKIKTTSTGIYTHSQ